MIDSRYLLVLRDMYFRLLQHPVNWVVTGSVGLALQGVPVVCHDIDVQTDEAGAYTLERLFTSSIIRPVRFSSAERIQSHFGALELHGIQVEIMGAMQYRRADGTWESPTEFQRYKHHVSIQDIRIPVLALTYECQAYSRLGRTDKVELLQRWLTKQA